MDAMLLSSTTTFLPLSPPPRAHIPNLRQRLLTLLPPQISSNKASAASHGTARGTNRRMHVVYASSSDPSDGKLNRDKPRSSETPKGSGPPVLTILAGFLVFVLLLCVAGFILSWIIGLIVNPPPSPK